jgi:hypothetical protein
MNNMEPEYDQLYPYELEFQKWVEEQEQQAARPTIKVQLGRDRFLFDQDDEQDQFSPYNTVNS